MTGRPCPVKSPSEKPNVAVREIRLAKLVYSSVDTPGLTRQRVGKRFRYLDPHGKVVRKPRTLERIRKLAIPPAWKDVWICRQARGHIQAVGVDARNRKQYLYHPAWRFYRDQSKFDQLAAFGRELPRLRHRIRRDLRRPGLPKEKVVATIVQLLDATNLRVGNEEYARSNGSYGLTTLRDKHVSVRGSRLKVEFRGKSGVRHSVELNDPRLARIVRGCQELPGQHLFQYVDEEGHRKRITSQDVNAYLREAAGREVTAKEFRTWAGTVAAATALCKRRLGQTEKETRRIVAEAVSEVAKQLGNTVAVCRKSYIHPSLLTCFTDGTLKRHVRRCPARKGLSREETMLLGFLNTLA